MSKEIYISSTPHETRLAIVEKDELTEIYYERENEYTLAGSIYNGRVTRVLPGMQSSFVDIGLERDAFLYITDFMEEAGDSADFEPATGANGGAASNGSSSRPRSGERSGRGEGRGEGRGRGRRDERGREGQDSSVNARSLEEPRGYTEPRSTFAPGLAPGEEDEFDRAPAAADSQQANEGDLGDGATGADGSRRWRGRRGRRRGRGGSSEPGVETHTEGRTEERSDALAAERSAEPEPDSYRAPREDRSAREGRERSSERGGRDRPRSGGGSDSRHEAVRERFAPRDASGRRAGGNESRDEAVDLGASAEPFILPGESLSKYRRETPAGNGADASDGSATPAPQPSHAPQGSPKPSTEAPALVGWDGGSVLPGETLSRHREPRNEQPSQPREQDRERSFERGRDRRRERDQRHGRGTERGSNDQSSSYSARPRELDPAEAVLPAVTSQHEPEATVLPLSDDAPDFALAATETRLEMEHHAAEHHDGSSPFALEHAPHTEAAAPEATRDATEEFHETVAEYEPEDDASASYRVDPAAASEFRQSPPVDEFEELHEQQDHAPAEAAPSHEFTSVQPTGEMFTEPPPGEEAAPNNSVTSPMEHEAAVQETHADEALSAAVAYPSSQSGTASASFQPGTVSASFEPGDGQLEEELLDEEESEIGELHASVYGSDMEEETLENTANHAPDLGSMIRDLSIDELTRSGAAELDDEDEEDDFDIDEEDLEEDELESTGARQDEDEHDAADGFSGSEISETEEDAFAEAGSFNEAPYESSGDAAGPNASAGEPQPERRGRRDGRRSGRDRGERGGDRGQRDRRGMANSRPNGSRGHGERGGRSMQATNLPAISDLLKPGQEVLVQIAKEPIAKKGARITSHIALPGRFLVFMPTVSHVGVSRKIESDGERRRLKEILLSEKGDASGGFIVRTAASGASEEELRSDLRFLLNLWADIKQRSDSSKSPALIYHDLNLVERILRDQVTDNFSAIWVDTETEYERVLRFLQRFQPSLIRRVKLYTKDTPLFEQFGIAEEINKALRSKVWLKSGGSIVINQTEALVAIDINTGKYVGKTARLEDTIVKTNLDAIPEIVRQIRLRDLGGIIIIDFIDMDERKNRNRVMAALEDELKKDRAPSKVLQFNDFGLVAITRKRVKQSLERTLSSTCAVCQGTGMTKSPVTVCNDIYIEMRKMHKVIEKGDIMLRVNPEVVKQLKSGSGKWLQEMEEMSGKTILVKSDPSLHPEQFDIH